MEKTRGMYILKVCYQNSFEYDKTAFNSFKYYVQFDSFLIYIVWATVQSYNLQSRNSPILPNQIHIHLHPNYIATDVPPS